MLHHLADCSSRVNTDEWNYLREQHNFSTNDRLVETGIQSVSLNTQCYVYGEIAHLPMLLAFGKKKHHQRQENDCRVKNKMSAQGYQHGMIMNHEVIRREKHCGR